MFVGFCSFLVQELVHLNCCLESKLSTVRQNQASAQASLMRFYQGVLIKFLKSFYRFTELVHIYC